jgi:hypothetical protein
MEGLAGCGFADRKGLEASGQHLRKKFGWGGRIRTFTILINSEVSYRLDHAPAACGGPRLAGVTRNRVGFAAISAAEGPSTIP